MSTVGRLSRPRGPVRPRECLLLLYSFHLLSVEQFKNPRVAVSLEGPEVGKRCWKRWQSPQETRVAATSERGSSAFNNEGTFFRPRLEGRLGLRQFGISGKPSRAHHTDRGKWPTDMLQVTPCAFVHSWPFLRDPQELLSCHLGRSFSCHAHLPTESSLTDGTLLSGTFLQSFFFLLYFNFICKFDSCTKSDVYFSFLTSSLYNSVWPLQCDLK